MRITTNYNNQTFGSTYRYNITRQNHEKANNASDVLDLLAVKNPDDLLMRQNFMNMKTIKETGVYSTMNISAHDKFDSYIETLLTTNNINFKKFSTDEVSSKENVYERLVVPDYLANEGMILALLDTDKIEELFRKDEGFYISSKRPSKDVCCCTKYEDFQNFIKTGVDIHAPYIVLYEEDDTLKMGVIDGRHRLAVMRDMGLDKIKFVINQDSLELAQKYGLMAE